MRLYFLKPDASSLTAARKQESQAIAKLEKLYPSAIPYIHVSNMVADLNEAGDGSARDFIDRPGPKAGEATLIVAPSQGVIPQRWYARVFGDERKNPERYLDHYLAKELATRPNTYLLTVNSAQTDNRDRGSKVARAVYQSPRHDTKLQDLKLEPMNMHRIAMDAGQVLSTEGSRLLLTWFNNLVTAPAPAAPVPAGKARAAQS